MAAFSFKGIHSWPVLRQKLEALFNVTTGHAHDGVDSKAIAAGTADDTTLALAAGVFSVKDGGIVAAKLAADAVETAKIKNANVTAAKLAADAVEEAKIKDGAVTAAKTAAAVQTSLGKADVSVAGVAAGYKVARADGVVAVTGTAEITSGLATVKAVAVTLAEDVAATGAFVSVVIPAQAGADAGKFTIKVWKSDLSAADAAKNVSWVAVGT